MSNLSMKVATSVAIIGGMIVSAVSASAALNLPTQSCAYVFNTNMKLGSRGTDVMNLQKVLNMYPQTQVSASGAGSPGMETSYFGPATRTAANKFQALHLVELGITAPTGNVFAGTRGLLNQVCNGTVSQIPGQPPVISGPVAASLSGNQPTGMVVASQSGARLLDVTLTGNGAVTAMQLQRIGASADTDLTNVYLYDGNTRITDAASVVTGGYVNFNLASNPVVVNGSRTITVRADLSSSVSGRSVGLKVNSVTAGGAVTTYTNIVGNTLQGSSVTTATVDFAAITNGTATVDAGTMAYNVWTGSATVSTRAVLLRAATFKFVGSAPTDALANMNLFVDGTKVAGPSSINAANGNKVTFDLGATPYNLTTGTHTIDVRADIVKGSWRTITMSVENVSDLMFEDSQLTGVNIGTTVASAALTQGISTYNTITVNKGSVTVNVDPSFSANKVTGGATNVPIGQFLLKAYGEDVKIQTLQVDVATTTGVTTLNNVSLYANGGQVGTSQNITQQTAAAGNVYTLGSALIIPANTTVTLTVKADIVNSSNAAYTSGSVAAVVGGTPNNAQGVSSNELVSVASSAVTGNVLTVSSGAGTFARTSGFAGSTVSPNTTNVKIGSFIIQANSSEAIKMNSIGVNPIVSGQNGNTTSSVANAITNYSNLTVKSGSTVIGTPIGNPASGTSTFSFNDITIPANGTYSLDVYADIGGAASSTDNPTVTTAMSVTYRGAVSNTTTTSSAAGVAIASAASTLATPVRTSGSATAQFVVGGSTFGIATFKLATAAAGTQANVRELRFITTGTNAIESITVGGVTAPVMGSTADATTTISGLSIPVTYTGTDVPVTVKFAGFQGSTSGGSLTGDVATVNITLGYVEGTSGSGSVITSITGASSNNMRLVASKPTVTMSAGNTDTLILGAESKVAEFTVTADANGKISLASTSITMSAQGVTAGYEITGARLVADGVTVPTSGLDPTATASTTAIFAMTTPYEIGAGQSKTFSVFATVSGTAVSGYTPYVASSLTAGGTDFVWKDVIGNNTAQTGALIYGFPTNSFTTKR